MTGRYAVRDQLAAALGDAWQRGVFFVVDNPGTVSSPTRVDFGLYADALLPVVDRIANEHAAAAEVRGYERGRHDFQFAPEGDNHHNAALCPYCTPEAES